MAVLREVEVGDVCRAIDLRAGDAFETLHTRGVGYRTPNRLNGASVGVSVEIWYPDGQEIKRSLDPRVKVRLVERARRTA